MAENPDSVEIVDTIRKVQVQIKEGKRISAKDAGLLLDDINRLTKVAIALHSSLAQLYAWCEPEQQFQTLGTKAKEEAWEIMCRDDPGIKRANELEKAEKTAVVYETALERISRGKAWGIEMRVARKALGEGRKIHAE